MYISGKHGAIVRIDGLNIEEDLSNCTMLDIKVEAATIAIVGGASVVVPGQQPYMPPERS